MTLIIGTAHWNGICLNSDTRVTNTRTHKYNDNAQKMAHIHGGVGMLACGDKASSIIVREVIRNHLNEFAKTNIKFPQQVDLQSVFQSLFKESLKELRNHPLNLKRPIYEVNSSGLIGINIMDQSLALDKEESNNILKIIIEGKKINSFYTKYIEQIGLCANGQIEKAILKDLKQHTLFKYKVKLFDDKDSDIYEVHKVPFGKIVAMGSGSEFNYEAVESKVLSFVLFSEGADDVGNGAFHLGMIHHFAEKSIDVDKRFNFRTFGGAIIACMIQTNKDGNGSTNIFLGDVRDKKTGSVISSVEIMNNDLWVTTQSGEKLKLETFPEKFTYNDKFSW